MSHIHSLTSAESRLLIQQQSEFSTTIITDAGFRCNVCIIEEGSNLLIYVLYDG